MQSTIKKLPKSELEIKVELTADEFESYKKTATQQLAQEVEVKGFRKGQAPGYLIISQIGQEAFFQAVLDVALPKSYYKVVTENKLEVASRPSVNIISREPLTYEIKVATLPEVKIEDIDKLTIPAEKAELTDAEFDEVIKEMKKLHATYKDVERATQKGDRVEIDFEGFDESGKSLDNTKSKNHPVTIGEKSLVPGFEDALIGMKKTEKKKFPITFPKDYSHEPFRNKMVHFEVTLNRIEEAALPEFTEELVEKIIGKKKPVEEFKKLLKEDLTARKKQESEKKREAQLFETLLKKAKLEVSQLLIDEEVDAMLESLAEDLEKRKMKLEQFLENMKKQKRDIRKEYEVEAVSRVKIRIIMQHLFKTLPIEVGDDEVNSVLVKALKQIPEDEKARIEKEVAEKRGVFMRVKNNLMLEKLLKRFCP